MKFRFIIHYNTQWGQRLFIGGSAPELGGWKPESAIPLPYLENGRWEWEGEIKSPQGFEYKYGILDENTGAFTWEWGANRIVEPFDTGFQRVDLIDFWRPEKDMEHTFFTSAFTRALMSRPPGEKTDTPVASVPETGMLYQFRLYAPRIDSRYSFCIVGNHPSLGDWKENKAIVMDDSDYPLWKVTFPMLVTVGIIEYKYGIYDRETKKIVAWETGENRKLFHTPIRGKKTAAVVTDIKFRYPNSEWKAAGVALPVFSLRSESSTGVGEFADIKPLVDWAVKTGMKLVQILPVNDTVATHTWTDSYPYAAISVFALHPLYLNPEKMGKLKAAKKMKVFQAEKERLNALPEVDYEAVMNLKSAYFKDLYDQEKKKILKDPDFQLFLEENREWLVPYAVFSMLRDRYHTPDFSQWPDFSVYKAAEIEKLTSPDYENYDDVAVHYFIQYHLHHQLKESADYARSKGVVLKGDIPIGIYRHSVDAWTSPHLYKMDAQAGAPPDDFAITGQNWGFPTYNWEEMAKDGFAWWKSRLQHLSAYFDAFRIDHILGFFRIWEIPGDAVEGLLGQFNPSLPLSREELAQRGLWMDYERYCKPYIPAYLVNEFLGEYAERAAREFLEMGRNGRFRIQEPFQTQKAVEAYCLAKQAEKPEDKTYYDRAKEALFGMIREVIFLEAPGSEGQAFNPRIALHFTKSFADLDYGTQQTINRLYDDYFYHRHEWFWRDQAMVKLPALKAATDMLVCGEDLGMVPACVPGVMDDLGILSLEIQRMPKNPEREFGVPAEAPYMSVSSPSSHDMSTVRGWWEENRNKTQRFYNHILGYAGEAPYYCEPWICREIIDRHLKSPSMWTIFPIQDLVAMDENLRLENPHAERINVPSNPKHYWRYRFHLSLETLLQKDEFNDYLREMIRISGRNTAF
ncbi:MAG: 4-alpha-glucanotransferase [Bacteroidia bacterium]|nr:4-alpha-glucanotransferase [Bacteroidia bacterium]